MNHAYACRKDATGEPPCKQWCGRSDLCLSTRAYPEDYMQTAYERGHREALEKAAQACDQLAQSTSPHRRMAGKDMAEAIRKIKPTAGVAPSAEPQQKGGA